MKLVLAASALATLLLAAEPADDKPDPRDFGPGTIDVSRYPAEQKKNYDMYAAKCAKCHPLARSVNARFSAQEWKKYMKRMIRRPNSGINEEQAATVYDFLKYYSAQLGL
jgi:glucan phosphorylase